MKPKKILVTGALGHIGSLLIRKFPDSFDHPEIVMIDNMSTQRYCSLFNLPENAQYRFIEADILKTDLTDIAHHLDLVIHLAAITDAASSFSNKEKVEKENLGMTTKIAELCSQYNIPLIFLSSTSVYGAQEKTVTEDSTKDELNPQSPYAETKLKEENIIQLSAQSKQFPFVIFRFGTIFGVSPGMRFHTAVNKFCWQAVLNQPLTVWKTAYHQKRPYLDLNDGIRAIIHTIENNLFTNSIFNILTLNATVHDIISSTQISFVDSQIMNQMSYTVSTEKFLKNGFSYHGSLSQGINQTLDLLKQAYLR